MRWQSRSRRMMILRCPTPASSPSLEMPSSCSSQYKPPYGSCWPPTLGQPEQLTLEWAHSRMTIHAGKSRFSLQTLPTADFQLVRTATSFGQPLCLSQKLLKRMPDALCHGAERRLPLSRGHAGGHRWPADAYGCYRRRPPPLIHDPCPDGECRGAPLN